MPTLLSDRKCGKNKHIATAVLRYGSGAYLEGAMAPLWVARIVQLA